MFEESTLVRVRHLFASLTLEDDKNKIRVASLLNTIVLGLRHQ